MMSTSNIESIDDHMAHVCECGSVRFNLLRSGKIECDRCGRRFDYWANQQNISAAGVILAKNVYLRREDGKCWLIFATEAGCEASISIEMLFDEEDPIFSDIIRTWAKEQNA